MEQFCKIFTVYLQGFSARFWRCVARYGSGNGEVDVAFGRIYTRAKLKNGTKTRPMKTK